MSRAFSEDEVIINYVFEHADAFLLLLKASGGTAFEDFPSLVINAEKESALAFFEQCKPFVANPNNLSSNIASQTSAVIVSTVFDCLLAGATKDQIIREAQLASEFCIAGLRQIWGI